MSQASDSVSESIPKGVLTRKDKPHSGQLADAAFAGDVGRVKKLLKRGADVNPQFEAPGYEVVDPLRAAIKGRSAECVKLLLGAGADVERYDLGNDNRSPLMVAATIDKSLVNILMEAGASIRAKDARGMTALHWAAIVGNCECVELLLNAGMDPNEKSDSGWTPMFFALSDAGIPSENKYKTISLLVEHGADINTKDLNGRSALIQSIAALTVSAKDVKGLLNLGAEADCVETYTGHSAASYACRWGKSEILNELIIAGADTQRRTSEGKTPLMIAAGKSKECVSILLRAGSPVNDVDNKGLTALFYAAKCGMSECVDVLLKNGADPEHRCEKGRSALFVADDLRSAMSLIDSGCAVNALDKDGISYIWNCIDMGRDELVAELVERGYELRAEDTELLGEKRCSMRHAWAALESNQLKAQVHRSEESNSSIGL